MSKQSTPAAVRPVRTPASAPGPRPVRKARRSPVYTLRLLREALDLTQVEVAARSGIAQSELSKIERRGDAHVSTLEKYAAGLGGELELRVNVGGRSYRLAMVDDRA